MLEYVRISYKQFSDWLRPMSVTEEWVICCNMCCVYEIGMRIPFPNKVGMLQIIYIGSLLITTFVFVHLPHYCLLFVVILSMLISPEIQHLQLL